MSTRQQQLGLASRTVVSFRRLYSWFTFFAVFGLLGSIFYTGYQYAVSRNPSYRGIFILGLGYAILASGIGFVFNEIIVVLMLGAKRVNKETLQASNMGYLWDEYEAVYSRSGLWAQPRLYVIPTRSVNACAFGWGLPGFSAVAVTQGLIQSMPNSEERQAVLAHELGHIKNKDIVVAILISTILGALIVIADILVRVVSFGSVGKKDDDDDKKSSPWPLLLMAALFLLIGRVIGPLLSLAVNRSREYSADALAAKIMGSGQPMAAALATISGKPKDIATKVGRHFFLVPALWMDSDVFSTHPSISKRRAKVRVLDDK